MKVILEDFNYKGNHFDRWEAELQQVIDWEDIPEEKLIEYIADSLDAFLEEN